MKNMKNNVTTNFNDIMNKLNKNFEVEKEEDEKENSNESDNSFNESGCFFDLFMFHNRYYLNITKAEAIYFLHLENYNVKRDQYKANLTELYKKRSNLTSSSSYYRVKETVDLKKILLIGKCASI